MGNKFLSQQVFFLTAILTFISFIIYGYSDLYPNYIKSFYNSDTMYIPTIYNDLFVKKIGLSGWTFNIAPNFFPDMLIYFPIHKLTNDVVYSGLFYGIAQNVIIAFIIVLISKQVFKNDALIKSGVIILLFSTNFLCLTLSRNYDYSFNLLVSGFHTSSFVLSILSFGIWLWFKKTKNKKSFYLIFLISMLASLSDKLYIFGFIIPIIIIFLFQLIFLKGYSADRKFFLIAMVGAAAGIFLYYFIQNNTPIRYMHKPVEIDFDSILYSVNVMLNYFNIIYRKIHLLSVFNTLIILSLCYSTYKIFSITKKKDKTNKDYISLTFHLFLVVNIICVFLGPILTGVLKFPAQIRYNIFYYYFGIIGIGFNLIELLSKYRFQKQIYQIFILLSLVSLVFFSVKNNSISRLNKSLNFEPNYINFFNETTKTYSLSRGLATYWLAKQSTIFNSQNIEVCAINKALHPRFGSTQNKNWYISKNESNPVLFDFIMLQKNVDISHIIKIFKEDNLKIIEGEKVKIIITPKFYLTPWDYKIKVFSDNRIN